MEALSKFDTAIFEFSKNTKFIKSSERLAFQPKRELSPFMNAHSNSLLANLPESEWQLILPHLQLVSLVKGQTLFRLGEVPSHVYFPVGAVVSMMNDSSGGESLETFMLGKTCMVGVGTLGQPSFYRALVRSSGLAYQMSMNSLIQLRSTCPAYSRNATAAINRMMMQMSQALACSKLHSFEQQIIRWMLITLDRTFEPLIQITHQELADILGFRRESVSLNLKKMADHKDILVRRGSIEVLNRPSLEQRSCDCYWIGQQKRRTAQSQEAVVL